jgi:hypothetical protein
MMEAIRSTRIGTRLASLPTNFLPSLSLSFYIIALSLFLSVGTAFAPTWSANGTVEYVGLQASTSKLYSTRKEIYPLFALSYVPLCYHA